MATIDQRKNENGIVSYRVRIRLKGYPIQVETFRRLTDAKRWVQQTEAAIREGRHFKVSASKKHTLGEAIDRYIKAILPRKPKSYHQQSRQLFWWKEMLGPYLLSDLTPALITETQEKLLERITQHDRPMTLSTANRYRAALSHLFTILVNEWEWLEHSPLRKVKKFREPRGRVRFLSSEERHCLLQACKESENFNLYPVVVLAISTGMRKGEILNLLWDDIDFPRQRIYLQETKNDERRGVPLMGMAFQVLKDHSKVRRLDTPFVFPSDYSKKTKKPIDIRASWEAALKKSAVEDFRFHDLRHSAASELAMNGANLSEIAEILGHKTLSMVKRYSHLADSHTAAVVERMNRKLFA